MQWCSSDQLFSNKKKIFSTFGEPTSQEALILAEKCEPDADKSDEEEKDPTTTEPSDQVSDHKLDTITSTLRSPLISWLYKQNMVEIFGYAPHYEHMLLAIFVCEPEAEKSDEGEKSPEPMEPPDQASDLWCTPEVIPTLRSPPTNPVPEKKIGPIYQYPKEFKLAECGAEQEVVREENKVSVNEKTDVLTHQQEDKDFAQSEITPSKKQAKKYIIPLKGFQPLPKTYISIYPCLKDLSAEIGIQEASDLWCLPEVIPTMRSPPTNPVPEKKIGPIYQYPKEFKLATFGAEQEVEEAREKDNVSSNEKTVVKHHQEDQSENMPSKNQAKKKIIPLKITQPLPETYIPMYPLKDLMTEYGSHEAPNAPVDAKDELQDSTKNSSDQSGNNSPQSGKIPSKDKIMKKKITFKIIHPLPLQKKDRFLTLQVKEGSETKQKFRIESFKTNQNHEWTSPPLIFDVGKNEALFLNVKEKLTSFGSMSRLMERGRILGLAKYKNGTYKWNNMTAFRSIIPGLKIEVEVEDIYETIKNPDSGQNKTQQKINPGFLKNEFLHLKERLRKRRSM